MAYQIRILLLSAVLTLVTFANSYDHQHRRAVERIKRYAKRQISGNCLYSMCNETEGYPADEIEQMIEKKAEYKELFGTVVEPYKLILNSRFAELGEETMCKTESIYMLPQKALDADGAWQIVVNVAGKFQQIVRFEACALGAKCLADGYIPGRETYCAQNEILLKMLSFDAHESDPDKIPLKMLAFRIPSGCACVHKPA